MATTSGSISDKQVQFGIHWEKLLAVYIVLLVAKPAVKEQFPRRD